MTENQLIDEIIIAFGNHSTKPAKVSTADFYRRAVAMQNYRAGQDIDGIKRAGFSSPYAKNFKVLIEQCGVGALYAQGGKPRRIKIELSKETEAGLQLIAHQQSEAGYRARVILDYVAGSGVYDIAKRYNFTKTQIYHILNEAALGEIGMSLTERCAPIVVNMSKPDRIAVTEIIGSDEYCDEIKNRARLVLDLQSAKASYQVLSEQYGVRYDFKHLLAKYGPLGAVLWQKKRKRVSKKLLESIKSNIDELIDVSPVSKKAAILLHYNDLVIDAEIARRLKVSRQYVGTAIKWFESDPNRISEAINVSL